MRYIWSVVFAAGLGCQPTEDADTNDTSEADEKATKTSTSELPAGIGTLIVGGINSLPDVTDPVLAVTGGDTSASDFDSQSGALQIDAFDLTAKSGLSLGNETTQAVLEGKETVAYGVCEMVNRGRGFLDFAALADEIDCELGFILGDSDRFYDGEFHVIEIVDDEFTERYKFKIEGTKAKVTGLTFYRCEDGVQRTYLKKTIDDDMLTIIAKRYAQPGNPDVRSFQGLVEVTGKVDEEGRLIGLKTIDNSYSNEFASGAISFVKEQVKQSSENLQYTGVMEQDDQDEPSKFIAFMELLDPNSDQDRYQLSKLALGDGAMVFSLGGDSPVVQGWNGDTLVPDTAASQIAKVEGFLDNLPKTPTPIDLSFKGDEIYDCLGTPDLSIDDATLVAREELLLLIEQEHNEHGDGSEGHGEDDGVCSLGKWSQDQHIDCHKFADQSGA